MTTSLRPRAGLASDRSMADSLCHRRLVSCRDTSNTLNVRNQIKSKSLGSTPVVYAVRSREGTSLLVRGTYILEYSTHVYGQHFQQSTDQPGKVANPARGQLN